MSSLFISHSSRDNDAVVDLQARLEERGYRSLFIDFDPQLGIAAGREWEQELYRQLKTCGALVALVSDHWLDSRWCFAELTQARALGKPVFALRIADCAISGLLADRQVVDVAAEGESAWERLWIGLRRAGLDPRDVFERDPARPPYPGLDAFERQDAAVYFGREAEVAEALEALHRMRRRREPRLLAVLGASGSGKSSLVRAGVLPRLVKDPERWVSLPPFRPGDDPGGALARAFAQALGEEDWKQIRDRLATGGSQAILDLAHDLAAASGHAETAVLLVIDQFDELLGKDVSGQAADFLRRLRQALAGPVYALLTLRSDFLGAFQKHRDLRDLAFANLTLGPMPAARLPLIVEGPAQRAGIELEAGLVSRMVSEAETDDALPLLAFTLREMWERDAERRSPAESPRLSAEDYDALGGIQGAVARAADDVLDGDLDDEEEKALRSAFLKMVRINEEGQFARRPVRLEALPASARAWIDRFAAARLLVIRGDGGETTVEVAHEALFRVWGKLVTWLAEERELLLWRQRLRAAEKEWQRTGRDESALLRGTPLAEAERWLAERSDELEDADRRFVQESTRLRRRQEAERERLAAERERRRRLQIRAVAAAATIFLALAALAALFWRRSEQDRRLAMARQLASQAALVGGDRGPGERSEKVTQSILLAAESLRLAPTREGYRELIEATRRVGRRPTSRIPAEGRVSAVAFSADGRLLASGGDEVRIWDTSTLEPVSPPLPGGEVWSLAFDPRGRWLAAGYGGRIRVWRLDDWREAARPIEIEGPARSLAVSGDGGLLAAADDNERVVLIATEGWRRRRPLATEDRAVGVAFAPDRPWLAVATAGGGVLFDADSGREIVRSMLGRAAWAVGLLPFGPPGDEGGQEYLLSLALEGVGLVKVPLYAGDSLITPAQVQEVLTGVYPRHLSVSSGRWAFADDDRDVWIDSGLRLIHDQRVESVALSPAGSLASADGGGWMWRDEDLRPASLEHDGPVVAMAASPSRPWVATADKDGLLRIFHAPSPGDVVWREAHSIEPAGAVSGLAFSPDGAFLAAAGDRIRIFAADGWRPVFSQDLPEPGSLPTFTADGRWLVLGRSESRFARVFEAGTWRAIDISVPEGEVLSWYFHLSDEGERLAIEVRRHHAIHVSAWDLTTGESAEAPNDGVQVPKEGWTQYRFDETVIDAGLFEAQRERSGLQLVDPVTDEDLIRLEHGSKVHAAAATSDGRWLLTAGDDGRVRIWPLQAGDLIARACARVRRNLTRQEWTRLVGEAEAYRLTCPKLGKA